MEVNIWNVKEMKETKKEGCKPEATQQLENNYRLTHRTRTNPEVFLLNVLDTLINAFVLQHLQGVTEQH